MIEKFDAVLLGEVEESMVNVIRDRRVECGRDVDGGKLQTL